MFVIVKGCEFSPVNRVCVCTSLVCAFWLLIDISSVREKCLRAQ